MNILYAIDPWFGFKFLDGVPRPRPDRGPATIPPTVVAPPVGHTIRWENDSNFIDIGQFIAGYIYATSDTFGQNPNWDVIATAAARELKQNDVLYYLANYPGKIQEGEGLYAPNGFFAHGPNSMWADVTVGSPTFGHQLSFDNFKVLTDHTAAAAVPFTPQPPPYAAPAGWHWEWHAFGWYLVADAVPAATGSGSQLAIPTDPNLIALAALTPFAAAKLVALAKALGIM